MNEQINRFVNCSCCGIAGERGDFYQDKLNDRYACVNVDDCIHRRNMRDASEHEVERLMHGIIGTQVDAIEDALEQAAMLHEQVDCASDAERLAGIPGAGAMGAVIEYRDKIRELKARLTGETVSEDNKLGRHCSDPNCSLVWIEAHWGRPTRLETTTYRTNTSGPYDPAQTD